FDRQTVECRRARGSGKDRFIRGEAARKERVQSAARADARPACAGESGKRLRGGIGVMANELNNSTEPIQSQFCGSLRSKKFFLLDRLAASADDYIDAANHVWCCETQEVI